MPELKDTKSSPGRLRITLLAGAMALAFAGGAVVSGVVGTLPGAALAQTEEAASVPAEMAPATTAAPFDFADLAAQVRGSVVSVQVEGGRPDVAMRDPGTPPGGLPEFFENLPEDHPMRRFFREYGIPFGNGEEGAPEPPRTPRGMPQQSQGSGFIISEDGYVVTNNHVVSRGDVIRIVLDDGREYTADIVGADRHTDLALLRIDAQEGEAFEYVDFAGEPARVGQWVIAVGNPFGLGGTVTAGIVSASGREIGAGPYDDFIQIDASVNRGNSGGPSFNLNGEVVGVNTAIFSPSGGNVGIAFAIPASVAVPVIEQLREHGEVSRGWLGVQIQPVTDEIADSVGLDRTEGAIVADLIDTGPAGEAGIVPGDVILSVDGQTVNDARDLARRIGGLHPGDDITIQVWRDEDVVDIEVTLARMPAADEQAAAERTPESQPEDETAGRLGLALAPGSQVGADRGVAIVDVDPDGEGARKGLVPGDLILEAGGAQVSTPEDVSDAVRQAEERGRGAILMRVQSEDDSQRFVALSLNGGAG